MILLVVAATFIL